MFFYMSMVKSAKEMAPGEMPPPPLMEAMGKLIEEMNAKGKMVTTGGLGPSAQGLKAKVAGGKIAFTDGPFAEAKEVIGGFAIMKAETREEMLEDTRRFLQLHIDNGITDVEVEVRPMSFPPGGGCG